MNKDEFNALLAKANERDKLKSGEELVAMAAEARARYEAMSPVDRAIADLEHRRNFVMGNLPLDRTPAEREARGAVINAMPEFVLMDAYLKLIRGE